MPLFSLQSEQQYQLHGTQCWKKLQSLPRNSTLSCQFMEKQVRGTNEQLTLFVDEQFIYFQKNSGLKGLRLCLTTLEENFYLLNNQRAYEIKLKTSETMTIFYTHNLEDYIIFYSHLAKFCILRTFKKHYKVDKVLGSGSFATVYNGINLFSKETVALKVFEKEKINDDQTKLIIINEIINLQKLRKYHLSPLIGTYQSSDCVILVLQKAQAGNMIDYLKTLSGKYDAKLIKLMMKKILQNLKQLHSAGFIHRDIKPQNIFFHTNSTKSSLFLGDFSLTVEKKDCECNLIARKCSGTLGFIAPQVLHENRYDEKCDLFSVGCLFYFLHKGENLFHLKTTKEIHTMIRDRNIISRKIKNLVNLTSQSENLLEKLLEIDPKNRISAQEALNHEYFQKLEECKVWTGDQDHTMRDYLMNRVSKVFN